MTSIYFLFSLSPAAQLHLKFAFTHSLCSFHIVDFQDRREHAALLLTAA